MALFRPKCPINATEQAWIDESMQWFVHEFGAAPLRRPVVLPTIEHFPGGYSGSDADIRQLVSTLCERMEVDPDRIAVELPSHADTELRGVLPTFEYRARSWAVGHYRVRDGKALISIAHEQAEQPVALVATIAHELSHERLIGEGRVTPERRDHEPLTDLLTVYLGLGIFSANAAFEFAQYRRGGGYGWQASRLGYLTELMYGYALARYAMMRGEAEPTWTEYLDVNPRVYMKKSLKYLRSSQIPL